MPKGIYGVHLLLTEKDIPFMGRIITNFLRKNPKREKRYNRELTQGRILRLRNTVLEDWNLEKMEFLTILTGILSEQ